MLSLSICKSDRIIVMQATVLEGANLGQRLKFEIPTIDQQALCVRNGGASNQGAADVQLALRGFSRCTRKPSHDVYSRFTDTNVVVPTPSSDDSISWRPKSVIGLFHACAFQLPMSAGRLLPL